MRFLRVNVNGRLSKVYRYFTPYLRDTNELEPQSGLNGRADKVRLRIGRLSCLSWNWRMRSSV
jgi:hypothetical protein